MRFWQKAGKRSDAAEKARGISRRALDGATRDELCEEVLRLVRPLLSRGVDRFGIWLAPEDFPSSGSLLTSFRGCFWDREQEPAVEWNSLDALLPLPAELLKKQSPVESRTGPAESVITAGPAAGMSWALWVPVVAGGQLQGVIFAAARRAHDEIPRDQLEQLAAELALALTLTARSAGLHAAQRDVALAKELWSPHDSTFTLDAALRRIVNSALHSGAERKPSGPFAMIGLLLPEKGHPQAPGNRPPEFRWVAGDHWLARAAMGEPMAAVWRDALQQAKTIGRDCSGLWPRQNVSRVVAVPLFAAGHTAGVLVAALSHSSANFANVERLEFRARLASTVLALAARDESISAGSESAKFFLKYATEPQFLLNASQEIISASKPGQALLSSTVEEARSGSASPQAVSSREDLAHHDRLAVATAAALFPPSEWQRLSAWLGDISNDASTCAAHSIETRLRSGRAARVHASALPGGNIALIVQPAAEAAAEGRQPSHELQSLIEWLDQGVVFFDKDENVRAVNLRFSQLFGLSASELADAKNLRDLIVLVAPRVIDPAHFAERWWGAARGDEAGLHEELQIAQPTSRLLERSSHTILDSSGVRTGRLELYRDLSAQQLFQTKLRKSERLASVGERVSAVAHELSNPLTTILGYAQRWLANPTAAPRRGDIQRICSEAERASNILRQLLGSARESRPEPGPVSLNSVIQRTAELQRFQLASEKIRLELNLAPDLPPILGDAGQLQQILMNLIANSRHAMLEHHGSGAISFRTRLDESGRVVLEVSDTGPGIPESLRHRIFDPFFTTKPPGQGTGLGLSIVAGLVRQHGGHIRLQSSQRGTTFEIDFPLAASSADASHRLPALPPAISSSLRIGRGERVLVVEDEPTVAQLIADMLADLGYTSDVQHSARRALVSALNRDYAFVICDMKMPGLDGQHFYRALGDAGSPLVMRFLFVTGDVLGAATHEFLKQNRLPYIAKPFRIEEFTEKVAQLFAKPAAASSQHLSHRNLVGHG